MLSSGGIDTASSSSAVSRVSALSAVVRSPEKGGGSQECRYKLRKLLSEPNSMQSSVEMV